MNPRIVATVGPIKGSEFPITETEFTFGRLEGNDVNLEDDLVSRRHCGIRLQDGRVVVRDLGSRNGTFVNGEHVSTRVLKHRDVLKIGSSILIYMDGKDEDDDAPVFVDGDADRLRNVTTLQVKRAEPLFPDTDPLRARFLELISQSFPEAKRAAVLLAGRASGPQFVTGSYLPSKFAVSRMVTELALRDGLPVLSDDVDSVLCAPMLAKGTRLGVLYLDSPEKGVFDKPQLNLLSAIAAAASEAFERARYGEWLEAENQRLNSESDIEHDMIGASPKMREVYDAIWRVASSEANVLITGQTGTGKELAARAIHRNSLRYERPFIAVNCGAIPDSLMESELFGHDKGAFTGAVSQRKGKIESADSGTLFLDEIGELPLSLQAGLLRVIQEREFERVGGTKTVKANIRLVAATNRNLEEEVKQGRFRQDLYFRLHVVAIRMPSLTERPEDIVPLIDHFISKHRRARGVSGVSPEAMPLFRNYDWPGNVRELENVIERACLLGKSDLIRPEDLPECMTECKPADRGKLLSYHDGLNKAKKALIEEAVRRAGGDHVEAAHLLDIHFTYLYRLMRNLYGES